MKSFIFQTHPTHILFEYYSSEIERFFFFKSAIINNNNTIYIAPFSKVRKRSMKEEGSGIPPKFQIIELHHVMAVAGKIS